MYWFNATIGGKPYIAKANITTATMAGKYYQTTVKMATVGDAILSDGKFATKGTSGKQAVIAYVGTVDKYFNHFLAIALTDAGNCGWSDVATNVNTYAAAHAITICGTTYNTNAIDNKCYDKTNSSGVITTPPTALVKGWRLPSVTDWRYVFSGFTDSSGAGTRPGLPSGVLPDDSGGGTNEEPPSPYLTAINDACGNGALQADHYWSSSENPAENPNEESRQMFGYDFKHKIFNVLGKNSDNGPVRAVFAY